MSQEPNPRLVVKSSPKLTVENIDDVIKKSGINIEDTVRFCPFCGLELDDSLTGEGILHNHDECSKGFYVVRVR